LKHDAREHAADTLEGFRVDEGTATLNPNGIPMDLRPTNCPPAREQRLV
jgi:hypothetical protein